MIKYLAIVLIGSLASCKEFKKPAPVVEQPVPVAPVEPVRPERDAPTLQRLSNSSIQGAGNHSDKKNKKSTFGSSLKGSKTSTDVKDKKMRFGASGLSK